VRGLPSKLRWIWPSPVRESVFLLALTIPITNKPPMAQRTTGSTVMMRRQDISMTDHWKHRWIQVSSCSQLEAQAYLLADIMFTCDQVHLLHHERMPTQGESNSSIGRKLLTGLLENSFWIVPLKILAIATAILGLYPQ
jgi:hypothetical protein